MSAPDEEFDLQPSEVKPEHTLAPEGAPAPDELEPMEPIEAVTEIELLPAEESAQPAPLEGPPPSDKVDFENLPEFVWQREMLRKVKIGALIAAAIVAFFLLIFFVFAGKVAKDTLKPAMDPLQPEGAEQKSE